MFAVRPAAVHTLPFYRFYRFYRFLLRNYRFVLLLLRFRPGVEGGYLSVCGQSR